MKINGLVLQGMTNAGKSLIVENMIGIIGMRTTGGGVSLSTDTGRGVVLSPVGHVNPL